MGSLTLEAKRRLWGSTPNLAEPRLDAVRVSLSYNQEQEFSVGHLPPDHPIHHVVEAFQIDGPIDPQILETSLQEIVKRHDSLRSTFVMGSKPVQLVHAYMDVSLNVVDLRKSHHDANGIKQLLSEEAQRPLNISTGPLVRATLYKLALNKSALVVTTHRAACDEPSMKLLILEIFATYDAIVHDQPSPLPLPSMQYSEFAEWQRSNFPEAKVQAKIQQWKKFMGGISLVVQLPTDYTLPPSPTYKGARHYFTLPVSVSDKLKELSQKYGVSLRTILFAAFQTLLQRYTSQTDFAVGTIVNSQLLPGLQKLIGCFSNVAILQTDVDDNPTFENLLKEVEKTNDKNAEFTDLPLRKALKEIGGLQESMTNVVFTYDEDPLSLLPVNGFRFSRLNLDIDAAKFELLLSLLTTTDSISGFFEYNPDLFAAETIFRLNGHFQTLLQGIGQAPHLKISKISMLTRDEMVQLNTWNNNIDDFPPEKFVHGMIESKVNLHPNKEAVVHGEERLSYFELNQRANKVAHYLQSVGVGPEKLVAVCLAKGVDMVVAVLAVLKAGGAFVFVDPNYPLDRISFMLADTSALVLLTQESVKSSLPPLSKINVFYMDRPETFASSPDHNPTSNVTEKNLAYVQYTSGSTGKPKGVMIEHFHFTTNLYAGGHFYDTPEVANQLAATTLSYVPGILEVFFPLCFGQRMIIAPNAFVLNSIPCGREVNYVGAVPSIMVELLRMNALPPSVHTVAMFGEPVSKQMVQQIYEQTRVQRILIHYGCTEAGTCVIAPVEKSYRKNPPIGRPLLNSQFHVLDNEMQPVPIGIPGELYIVSAGLGRGYMNRPELTSERFIPNPFRHGLIPSDQTPGVEPPEWTERMYKTGDLVRYRLDGTLDILGRIDHQVKIRGIRVELGEIETAIQHHPEVEEVVVTAYQPPVGDKKLVAYLVSGGKKTLTANELKNFLQGVLPQHMVPYSYIFLDKMPLTANGKVDRKLLPSPQTTQAPQNGVTNEGRNEIEKKMANIWSEILNLPTVNIDDNFYEIGGNSLRAIQLMMRVSEEFKADMPARCLFENPTVEALCSVVESAQQGNMFTSEPFDPEEEAVLDEDIYPARAYVDVETIWNPKHIFLTGATGFLGAFILRDLMQQTKAEVHCLVRAANVKEGHKRLQTNLEKYNLWHPSFAYRIRAVKGDLEKPMLGMTRTTFAQLGQRIDVIYHCGAPVNFVKPYSTLKPGSVLGTQEILRLSCLFKVKPVHYVSSVVVLASTKKRVVNEMDDLNSHNSFFHMGYTRAKWVGEMLLWIAKSRGLPVTVLRPGYVVGHSHTGSTNTNDYMARLVKGCIQAGSYPDMNDMMWLIPVDYVSNAIVHLTRLPQSLGKAFHLGPMPGHDVTTVQMLSMVKDYGFPLRQIPSDKWVEELENQVKQGKENDLIPLLPYIQHKYRDDYEAQSKRTADYDNTNTLTGLIGSPITCPLIDSKIVHTILNFYIKCGYIDAPNK